MEHGKLTEEETRGHVRNCGGQQGGSEDAGGEIALQFFEHEHQPRERCVEGGGETRTGSRGDECAPLVRGRGKPTTHHRADGRAHLHGRSLATER